MCQYSFWSERKRGSILTVLVQNQLFIVGYLRLELVFFAGRFFETIQTAFSFVLQPTKFGVCVFGDRYNWKRRTPSGVRYGNFSY